MGHAEAQDTKKAKRTGPRMRQVIVAAGIIGVVAAPMGIAATGDGLREGVRNGTATQETEIVSNNNATTGLKGGYSTRQSNLSSSGGGAIYGCRSGAGTSASTPPQNPCVRANNLNRGLAFEFNATNGNQVGSITASGAGGDQVKPFTTNATGVATGLNADRVDGLDAAAIATGAAAAAATDATNKVAASADRWALIGADGAIVNQSGGFTVVDCYKSNANCYIDAGEDVTNNAITAEIATANNPNPGPDGAEFLTGETSSAACFLGFVNCGPAGTDSTNGGNAGVLVVAPRNSDGTMPAADDRYPFYVTVSGLDAG